MQITFLIGNGFDMRMGIASSYKSAEEHYTKLKKTDEDLKKFQKSLSKNGEYWSNFELATGKYTAEFGESEQGIFQKCIDDFIVELTSYLSQEEGKIDYTLCKEEIKKEFFRSVSSYAGELANKYKNQLNSIITIADHLTIRFISFNYTHILDECLKLSFVDGNSFGSHNYNGARYNHSVNREVIHIHGALPGPIIMGVDNPTQIANKTWASQKRFRQKAVKPSMNERAGLLVDTDALKTINKSSIICVFGMSLGDTDKTWWTTIGAWLKSDNHRLIIFAHNSKISEKDLTYSKRFELEDIEKDHFMDLAGISETDRGIIEDRIFVYINSGLFNINLVELTKEKNADSEGTTTFKFISSAEAIPLNEAELTTIT